MKKNVRDTKVQKSPRPLEAKDAAKVCGGEIRKQPDAEGKIRGTLLL